ncbi:MAG: ABC transporter ATP-binding protein [Methanothrix sp.]|nr:ABC transporter ATP-binding protein [Methanothrix sp.]
MAKIRADNVKKTFKIKKEGNEFDELPALAGVNLEIDPGEFMVIVGPSGCGKSTFLDLVGGLTHPDEGTIAIDGKPITGPSRDRAIVFQQNALFPWRTTLGNVEFGLESINPDQDERREIALDYLSLVGLSGYHNHYPHQLSGGMKQRVSIARALALNPSIMLMDEPLAALDAQTREFLQRDILRISKESRKTVLFITHSIDEAVFLGDKVAVMSARPGVIKRVVDIPLTAEERASDDVVAATEFVQSRQLLWRLLKEEVVKVEEAQSNIHAEDHSNSLLLDKKTGLINSVRAFARI